MNVTTPSTLPATQACAVLMATTGRRDLLQSVSLPSVRRQTRAPVLVVLVDDGGIIAPKDAQDFAGVLRGIDFIQIQNRRVAGAAGAWNTGLEFLASRGFDAFVAMLDDDDEWHENHLAANLDAARHANASVVISGLHFVRDGTLCERAIPKDFSDRMFLVGNPGWQGSNTFASMRALATVGGFRDGLASCNDRDLAIRLLRCPEVRVAYTGKWTATWQLSSNRQTLSSPCSQAKLRGLRWFWQIYGSEMERAEAEEFFARTSALFRIGREDILSVTDDRPPHCDPRGDLFL